MIFMLATFLVTLHNGECTELLSISVCGVRAVPFESCHPDTKKALKINGFKGFSLALVQFLYSEFSQFIGAVYIRLHQDLYYKRVTGKGPVGGIFFYRL